jgi:YhhN-like protein.
MQTYQIIFAAAYLCILGCYLVSETSGNFRLRAWNKIVLASFFLIYGWAAGLISGHRDYTVLAMAGLVFAFIGDVWLLWSFRKGGVSFAIGNFFFLAYEICYAANRGIPFARLWWAAIAFAVLWGTSLTLCHRGWMQIPPKYNILKGYLATVTAQGTLGLALACALPDAKTRLLGTGLALFMVSDYFLALYMFRYKQSKWVLRSNSFTYFSGMLLVVLSIGF